MIPQRHRPRYRLHVPQLPQPGQGLQQASQQQPNAAALGQAPIRRADQFAETDWRAGVAVRDFCDIKQFQSVPVRHAAQKCARDDRQVLRCL